MLSKRIIPCLDVFGGKVVKGVQFENLKVLADPVTMGKYYSAEGADELVFYDIGASAESRGITAELVNHIASELTIPFTVGGGIRTLDDFYLVLGSGADKVSINSSAVNTPKLITAGAKRFGSQCVVVSMDVKAESDGRWQVYTHGGRVRTDLEALSWAKMAESLGAGELVINAIHTDGMKSGFDLKLTKAIAKIVSIPVVASGGAGQMEDFKAVLTEGMADAALAASVFHNKEIELSKLKDYLAAQGLCIRQNTK